MMTYCITSLGQRQLGSEINYKKILIVAKGKYRKSLLLQVQPPQPVTQEAVKEGLCVLRKGHTQAPC